MKSKLVWQLFALVMIVSLALAACAPAATPTAEQPAQPAEPTKAPEQPAQPAEPTKAPEQPAEPFVFGMVMVGPYNDNGWNTAHYVAGQYVEQKMNAKMLYIDKVNPADRPGTTPAQIAEQLLSQGAKFIIFNSDDMKDSSVDFNKAHPDVPMIHASGDYAWKEGKVYKPELKNYVNVMGRMEYGKMIAGCAAALTTQTGKIGYLGPLINDETRRLVASAYLGAKYCWTNYLGKDPKDLQFKVTWIGFWFNIPGVTSDPTQVANDFFNSGYDVLMSGIDTPEAQTEAKKQADAGKKVWAVPYDYEKACDVAPSICVGVPYFNWGPFYLRWIQAYLDGKYESAFEWLGPDWKDINNPDTSYVSFIKGPALSEENAKLVDKFIAELGGGLNLWKGPLNLQDGTVYLKDGEVATDQQIWYLPQLLEGMEGQSVQQ